MSQGDIGKVDYFTKLAEHLREMHYGDFRAGDTHAGKPWGWRMGLSVSCEELSRFQGGRGASTSNGLCSPGAALSVSIYLAGFQECFCPPRYHP